MRIAYWTTACLEPQIEAVSKEVSDLATAFRNSRIVAVSPHLTFALRLRDRSAGFHPRFAPLLRVAIPLIERAMDLNHIYSEVSPWLFFKALRRRPIVLTIASEKGGPVPEFLSRCDVVVAQTEGMRGRLSEWGMERRRVRIIYPGVDLARFTPRPSWSPPSRPSVLLATFPRSAEELAGRGVTLLLDTAMKYGEIDFSFVCRPWGTGNTAQAAVEERIRAQGLSNVRILQGVQDRMEALYKRHDFAVIPYTTADGGKECPRSLVEALACGVPVLISKVAPFASFITEHDCGRVFECSPEGFVAALESALSGYDAISENAKRAAQAHFDLRKTILDYRAIYDELG